MELYINDEKSSFTLENERTAADIANALQDWGHSQNMVLDRIVIDGEKYYTENETLSGIASEGINRIDVYFLHRTFSLLRSTEKILDWIFNAQNILASRKTVGQYKQELLEGLVWLKSGVGIIFSFGSLTSRGEEVSRLIKEAEIDLFRSRDDEDLCDKEFSLNTFEKLYTHYDFVKRYAENEWILYLCQNIESSQRSELKYYLGDAVSRLEEMIPSIAEMLQTDFSENVLGEVSYIAQTLSVVIKAQDTLDTDKTQLKKNASDLNHVLKQIEGSLKDQDMVYLSDLLEYELVEKLTYLKGIMELSHGN